jgi:hypothetical protein
MKMPLLPDSRCGSQASQPFFTAAGVLDVAAYLGHLGCPTGHLLIKSQRDPKMPQVYQPIESYTP